MTPSLMNSLKWNFYCVFLPTLNLERFFFKKKVIEINFPCIYHVLKSLFLGFLSLFIRVEFNVIKSCLAWDLKIKSKLFSILFSGSGNVCGKFIIFCVYLKRLFKNYKPSPEI
jgi:hypothetical protein